MQPNSFDFFMLRLRWLHDGLAFVYVDNVVSKIVSFVASLENRVKEKGGVLS